MDKIVDDFSSTPRYLAETNSLGYFTSDDRTSAERLSVQGDFLLLGVNPTTYWYTLLGPQNTFNDYSKYSKVLIGVRYLQGQTRFGFKVNLQDTDPAAN